jgi:rSAM/selenodomain-associated transferase 2
LHLKNPGEQVISKISIIMPVLNEEVNLASTLRQLSITDDEELIIVDGGSADNTVSIARKFTEKVYETKTGRASVMNYGAGKAEGSILLFLHSDCVLPDDAFRIIRETLDNKNVSAGAFLLGIDHPGLKFRLIEFGANLRSRVSSIVYGDQGIFLTKETFDKIGGYADIPLMEDIEISQRLKKCGNVVLLKSRVKASARRWLKEGAAYTTLRDWAIAFSYSFLNVPPDKLIKKYKDVR